MPKQTLTFHQQSKLFPITIQLSYDDMVETGYDCSQITDEVMEEIADDMVDGLMVVYWETLRAVADKYNLVKIS